MNPKAKFGRVTGPVALPGPWRCAECYLDNPETVSLCGKCGAAFKGGVHGRRADLFQEARDVRGDRGETYGERAYLAGGTRLGMAWSAVLSEHLGREIPPLPGHVVQLMMATMKLLRAARPGGYHKDNYVDALNYVHFGAESHSGQGQAKEEGTEASSELVDSDS